MLKPVIILPVKILLKSFRENYIVSLITVVFYFIVSISLPYYSPYSIEEEVEMVSPPKLILQWTQERVKEGVSFDEGVYRCGSDVCEVTWDRRLLDNASAVIFQDLYILNKTDLPSTPRQPDQHWVLHKREGPRLRPVFAWYNGLFTMTMGYHRRQDILRPYGITLTKDNEANPDYFNQDIIDMVYPQHKWMPTECNKNFRNHTTKVLWYISNCHYKTRNEYGRKLGNMLGVDVYGYCGKPGPCVAKQDDPQVCRHSLKTCD